MPCCVSPSSSSPSCIRRSARGRSPAVNSRQPRLCSAMRRAWSQMVLAGECHRLPEITTCSRHVPDLDEEGAPVDEDTPLVDAGTHRVSALRRGRAAASASASRPPRNRMRPRCPARKASRSWLPRCSATAAAWSISVSAGSSPWVSTVDFASVAVRRAATYPRSWSSQLVGRAAAETPSSRSPRTDQSSSFGRAAREIRRDRAQLELTRAARGWISLSGAWGVHSGRPSGQRAGRPGPRRGTRRRGSRSGVAGIVQRRRCGEGGAGPGRETLR